MNKNSATTVQMSHRLLRSITTSECINKQSRWYAC